MVILNLSHIHMLLIVKKVMHLQIHIMMHK